MSLITTEQIKAILLGTEHSGNDETVYRVSFAVPNSLLGQSHGNNSSGFSFGIVQLDLGQNEFAQDAYTEILNDALNDGVITQDRYNELILYRGVSRPDLDPIFEESYDDDRTFLNQVIFSREDAHNIIDNYNDQYIDQSLFGKVDNFLIAMATKWGADSVFDYNSEDYHTAVSAIVSIANRKGNLNQPTTFFLNNQPDDLSDVQAHYGSIPGINPADWALVGIGGQLFSEIDLRYEGVPSNTTFASAVGLLGVDNVDEVAELFLKSQLGNCISDVDYSGAGNAAFLVNAFAVPGVFNLDGGIFLSSGGFPGSANTSGSFTVSHGTAGDGQLSGTAQAAFSGAGVTRDASTISFKINVLNANVNGIKFDIVFGSDEYPEYSNSSYVDIAAIYVDGNNVALFNNNSTTPLSVVQQNVASGNFINNTSGGFATEWDGFSRVLTVRASLTLGEHTIKIGVADTGDASLDSGLYVNNIELLSTGGTGGGVLNVVNGSNSSDSILASILAEEINIFGGSDDVSGTPQQLNGDIITDFSDDDTLTFINTTFAQEDLTVTFGSAVLKIDTNQDEVVDTTVTLAGSFEGANFKVSQIGVNTVVAVEFPEMVNIITGTGALDNLVGTEGVDEIRSLAGSYDKSTGGAGADLFVFGAETMNGVRERDVLLDYEVGIDSIVLRDGAAVGSIRQTSSSVVVFLEGDGDAIYVQGVGVTSGNLTIVSDSVFV